MHLAQLADFSVLGRDQRLLHLGHLHEEVQIGQIEVGSEGLQDVAAVVLIEDEGPRLVFPGDPVIVEELGRLELRPGREAGFLGTPVVGEGRCFIAHARSPFYQLAWCGNVPVFPSLEALLTHTLVYPITSGHNPAGHLELDGCDVVALVEEFGTPLMIYEEKTIRDQCRRYMAAMGEHTADFEVIYASKAFSAVAVAQLVLEEGLSIDVSSAGEYYVAKTAGFPPERIFFHGNNKTRGELEYALEGGVGFVVVDGFQELALLEELVAGRGGRQQVLLRITPGVEAHTHSYIETGLVDSKFGFGLADGVALEAIREALVAEHLDLVGLHAHIGSQIFQLDAFRKAIAILVELIGQAHASFGFDCRYLNIGGGLGIRYTEEDLPSSIGDYATVKVEGVREEMSAMGLPMPRVLIEPGRSIVGKAGVTAYRVGTIKEIPGVRTYVCVDGGMSDNIRPMLYGAQYLGMLANKAEASADTTVTVAGKHCESSDVLIKDARIAKPEPGDILVMPATGAYCYAMASNYNGTPRPAVVLVNDGQARVIIERESLADLVAKHRPLRD
ncbi:MAG: diaminopimelate decarboxylase [Thermoleophilia bacterium]|nr:diaminopimelate decarboxylase [Thermoleophilia bacterium]